MLLPMVAPPPLPTRSLLRSAVAGVAEEELATARVFFLSVRSFRFSSLNSLTKRLSSDRFFSVATRKSSSGSSISFASRNFSSMSLSSVRIASTLRSCSAVSLGTLALSSIRLSTNEASMPLDARTSSRGLAAPNGFDLLPPPPPAAAVADAAVAPRGIKWRRGRSVGGATGCSKVSSGDVCSSTSSPQAILLSA